MQPLLYQVWHEAPGAWRCVIFTLAMTVLYLSPYYGEREEAELDAKRQLKIWK